MTKKKDFSPAGVPEFFISAVEDIVYSTMESNYAERLREHISEWQRRSIFHDFAEECWRVYQNYLTTRGRLEKIPAKRWDYLLKTARFALKDRVVIRPAKEASTDPERLPVDPLPTNLSVIEGGACG